MKGKSIRHAATPALLGPALMLAGSFLATPASAAKTIITFDDATANFVGSLAYPGVTFTGITNPPAAVAAANPGLTWPVATTASYIYPSGFGVGPNGTIGVHGFFTSVATGSSRSPVWAELSSPVNSVSVDLGDFTGGIALFGGGGRTLQAFGADGLLLGRIDDFVAFGQAGMRTYSIANPGIRYAYFGRTGLSSTLWGDNFCFGDGCGQRTPVGAIPEPSAWMLMILGFGLIAQQLRRRHLVRALG